MSKQRRKRGKMSFVEKVGLLFGIVGALADFTVLFTFATGISRINEYIPPYIPTKSALLAFSLLSGLIIIYGWFIASWYFIRRSFVKLGQLPVRFQYPLFGRSLRTVAGVGFVLLPLTIAWSFVNVTDADLLGFSRITPQLIVTRTTQSLTPFLSISETPISRQEEFETQLAPSQINLVTPIPPPSGSSLAPDTGSGWVFYFMFCYPFYTILFGFVIWVPINLLMPIVHVDLLLEEAQPGIIDELTDNFEE